MTKLTHKVFFSLLLLLSNQVFSANPTLDWKVHETAHFKIHYPSELKPLVSKVVYLAENSHKDLTTFFQWVPKNKTNIVMIDEFDQANGFASPLPNNTITLFMQPPTGGELLAFDDWLELLIHHEYVHTLHIDKVLDLPAFLRSIFGRLIVLFPNALHPNWFQEGLATYLESDSKRGIGRGESDVYQMMMRTEVNSRFKPISRINTVNAHDWPLNTAYLYGVYFFKFIRDVYGEEGIKRLINDYSENIIPYRVSSNPEGLTGKDTEKLWQDFGQYLNGYFQPQTDRIAKGALSSYKIINDDYFRFGGYQKTDGGDVWFSAQDEYQGFNLYRLARGENDRVEAMAKLNSLGSLDINEEEKVIVSQLDVCDEYNSFYDLYVYSDGLLRRISHCQRYREGRWMSKNRILALRYDASIPYLDELTATGKLVKNRWSGEQGDIIASFDVGPRGDVVAAFKQGAASWQIVHFKDDKWNALTSNSLLKMNPSIYGDSVSYIQAQLGQLEMHEVSLEGGNSTRLTQTQTGWSHLHRISNQKGLGLLYSSHGYQLAEVELEARSDLYQSTKNSIKETTTSVYPDLILEDKSYSPFSTMFPTYWMPVSIRSEGLNEIGVFTSGNDVLGNHIYTAQLSYERTTSEPLYNMTYIYSNKFVGGLSRRISVVSSEYQVYGLEEDWLLGFMNPSLSAVSSYIPYVAITNESLNLFTDNQNVVITGSAANNNWFGVGLIYDGLRSSRWASDHTQGWQGSISLESASVVDSNVRKGEVLNFNARHYSLFENNHIVAQRFVAGLGIDSDSLFLLGGTRSDGYIGPGITLNQRDYPLRGYNEGALFGENMLFYSAEYRLPFSWIDHTSMVPPIGLSGWSVRGFIDNGLAWREGEDIEKATFKSGAGVELVFDSSLMYYLNLKLRIGFASGLSEQGENKVYAELGGSF